MRLGGSYGHRRAVGVGPSCHRHLGGGRVSYPWYGLTVTVARSSCVVRAYGWFAGCGWFHESSRALPITEGNSLTDGRSYCPQRHWATRVREMDLFVETGVDGHTDDAVQAWTFDIRTWGLCGQGVSVEEAIEDLTTSGWDAMRAFLDRHETPGPSPPEDVHVAERIHGDEQAFRRDLRAATDAELERTLQIHGWARADLIHFVHSTTEDELDWQDPERQLPDWATWQTLRDMTWHILDCESRYYLPRLGVEPLRRSADLATELDRSARQVRRTLPRLARDVCTRFGGEVWTTTKVLRRLAWHERSELDAMRYLRAKARRKNGGVSRSEQ